MNVSDFDYELPPERIAQAPSAKRENARLLVAGQNREADRHQHIRDLPRILEAGDLLVVNDTRVRHARVHLRRSTGGSVEILLLAHEPEHGQFTWRALARPAARLKPGELVTDDTGEFQVRMRERVQGPEWLVDLPELSGSELDAQLERFGTLPLPPYIRREAGPSSSEDLERYQTVYARELGAVAAPTAGLHFTDALLEELEEVGVERTSVTLHVGAGTFQPVSVEQTEDHVMHTEFFRIPTATVEAVRRCKERGGRVVAVGTTSLRALESSLDEEGELVAGEGSTDLFLTPGSSFHVVDRLLTNFHLPRSTLLMLVSAFSGRERILELYQTAIELEYRFYSYGDAMLLRAR